MQITYQNDIFGQWLEVNLGTSGAILGAILEAILEPMLKISDNLVLRGGKGRGSEGVLLPPSVWF